MWGNIIEKRLMSFSFENTPRLSCKPAPVLISRIRKWSVEFTLLNRPFYTCVLSYLAMNASEAGGDLLIQTSMLFSCKCQLVSITT